MKKQVICFGEVLWDKLPEGARLGGAPLNVCYHLGKNGINSKIISQVGSDSLGLQLIDEMRKLDIDFGFLRSTDLYPTSTVEVILKEQGEVAYEIVENVAWDHISYEQDIATAISQADAFVFGSLIARSSESRDTLLRYLQMAQWVVLDINLRRPFYSKSVVFELIEHCHALKINEDEIALLGQWLQIGEGDESHFLDAILTRFPKMSEIILTKGAEGARYYSRDFSYDISAFHISPQDTIGSGDSFLAAFLASRLTGGSVEASMQRAALLSAFVATQVGACPTYDEAILNSFLQQYS